jgi:hypothetical protein
LRLQLFAASRHTFQMLTRRHIFAARTYFAITFRHASPLIISLARPQYSLPRFFLLPIRFQPPAAAADITLLFSPIRCFHIMSADASLLTLLPPFVLSYIYFATPISY